MSGGSLDYAEYKIEDIKDSLEDHCTVRPEFLPLVKHLEELGKVLHDIEWALSCDTSMTTDEAIKAVKSVTQPQDCFEAITEAYSKTEKQLEVFKKYTTERE